MVTTSPIMNRKGFQGSLIGIAALLTFLAACNNAAPPPAKDIAATPEELDKKVMELLQVSIDYAAGNEGKLDDSTRLINTLLVKQVYEGNGYTPLWSHLDQWKPLGDSMLRFIDQARLYGLFPEDYHFPELDGINKRFAADTAAKSDREDAVLWSRADLLLTDAFMRAVKDLKLGRLPTDSITMRKDSVLTDEFYQQQLQSLLQQQSLSSLFQTLEPAHEGYRLLKQSLPVFLDSARFGEMTKVPSPKDTTRFRPALQRRLFEEGFIAYDSVRADSVTLAEAVKRFQKKVGLTVDGKAGEATVRALNVTDRDRFVRIAITLDRYKMLPEKMPDRYVWVNLPGFYMRFHEGDTLSIESKIVCGTPLTRTPVLTSAISQLITYPQWTIPNSIIVKEILPALKKNTGYLAEKGYSLINSNGDEVHPDSVDWSKYSKGIPYKVVQGSGDENALGVLKFNFPNKYAVYLHDTNQRYLFARTQRSLSHGCVRVQEWQKLAYSIVRYDNREKYPHEVSPTEDSMTTWLARKEKHAIAVKNKLPVYIRYFSCEGKKDGGVIFYDDIYGEDRDLRQRYFAGK